MDRTLSSGSHIGDHMSLIARTQIKDIVGDFNVSEDFYPAFEKQVVEMLEKALIRAKLNKRRTLMAKDI